MFQETVDRCGALLDRVASQAGPLQSSGLAGVEERNEQRYTMHREREVHRTVTGGEAPDEVAVDAGDVEFF